MSQFGTPYQIGQNILPPSGPIQSPGQCSTQMPRTPPMLQIPQVQQMQNVSQIPPPMVATTWIQQQQSHPTCGQNWLPERQQTDPFRLNRTQISHDSQGRKDITHLMGYDAQGGSVMRDQHRNRAYDPYDSSFNSQFANNYMVFNDSNQGVSINRMLGPEYYPENRGTEAVDPALKLQPQRSMQGHQTRLDHFGRNMEELGQRAAEHQFQNPDYYNGRQYMPNYLEYMGRTQRSVGFSSPEFIHPPPQKGIYSGSINYQDQYTDQGLYHPTDFRNPYMMHQNNQLNEMRKLKYGHPTDFRNERIVPGEAFRLGQL